MTPNVYTAAIGLMFVGITLWFLFRWWRSARAVAVWPADPLAAGESVFLDFGEGTKIELNGQGAGPFIGQIPSKLLEASFIICRSPGDARETGFHGQSVPPRSAAAIDEPLWMFPAAWTDRQPHRGRNTRIGCYEDFPISNSTRVPGERMIRVHLPRAYEAQPERDFPVVYLLDGQNVFDASTAFGGVEWCIDEIAQRLEEQGEGTPILVGIDNGGVRREHEYTLCPMDGSEPKAGAERGGGAEEHLQFILQEVEPLIRQRYRVCQAPGALVGSSLGGLFALWAAIAHPEAFSAVAAVSPSIGWGKAAILSLPLAEGRRPRLWMCLGSNEGGNAEKAFQYGCRRLEALGWQQGVDMRALFVKNGYHHESAWADRSASILRFLAAEA